MDYENPEYMHTDIPSGLLEETLPYLATFS